MAFPQTPLAIVSELQVGGSYAVSGAFAAGVDTQSGGTIFLRDADGLDITADIDVRADVAPDDWTPPLTRAIAGKNLDYGIATANLGWLLELRTTGKLRLIWSPDGTFGNLEEAESTAATGLSDGTRKTVRAALDANDGGNPEGWTVTFFTGDTLAGPWTQLGNVVTGSGATSIAETDAPIEIGSTNGGQPGLGLSGNFQGRIYGCEVRDGIVGERIASPDFTNLPRGVEEFTDAEGNTWEVYGSSFIEHDWVDAAALTRADGGISITRGVPNEGGRADAASCDFDLDNADGRFSSRNPTGPYYGRLGRNTPHRVGIGGADGYLYVARPGYDYAFCPDTAGTSVVGDIDVRVDATLPSWQGLGATLIAKYLPGEVAWVLSVEDDGTPWFTWSADGTAEVQKHATLPLPVPHLGRKVLRATLDVNNGSAGNTVTFYTGSTLDGPWTRLGEPVVTAGVTSIYDSDAELYIAGYDTARTGIAHARVHGARVHNGIAGTAVANPDFTVLDRGTRAFTDAAGNAWRLAGGAEIVDLDLRHHGEVSSWPQAWDATGADVRVPASSAGILRRLGQGRTPLKSTLRRGIEGIGRDLVAYWPCEDADGATSLASGMAGGTPMSVSGQADLAAHTGFTGSEPIPLATGSVWSGFVRDYTDANEAFQFGFLLAVPVGGVAVDTPLVRVVTRDATVAIWQIHVDTSGNLRLYGFNQLLAVVLDSGALPFAVDGKLLRVAVGLAQDGTGVDWDVRVLEAGEDTATVEDGTLAAHTLGVAARVDVNIAGAADDVAVGHVYARRSVASLTPTAGELTGYTGEAAGVRIARLCGEEGVPAAVVGSASDTVPMGPQGTATLLDLLRECEDADGGILHEARWFPGLAYRTRSSMCAQAEYGGPALELDYAAGHLSALEPVDDDTRTRNDVTVTRDGGGSARAVQATGMLAVDRAGRYQEDVTVNVETDTALPDQAYWRLHLGAVDEARYPVLAVWLERPVFSGDAALTAAVRALDVGDLLTVENPPGFLPPDTIEQLAVGFREYLGTFAHRVGVNCAPASPWDTGVYGSPTSRYSPDSAALAAAIDSDDTTVYVTTPSGPLFQTVGDFPFDVAVGGERMTVTAVSGTSRTQHFTVTRSANGVVKSHAANTAVELVDRVFYAMGDPPPLSDFTPKAAPPAPPDPDPGVTAVFRYNCGGPLYTDDLGRVWAADAHFTGGTAANQGAADYGTDFDEVLKTERWGSFTYPIPFVPEGAATVVLHFAENHPATDSAGEREFDVTVNGVLALNDYDIYTEAGGQYTHVSESIATTIPASGICTVVFATTGSPNNAAACMGIEILAEGADPPPDPPPPDPPTGFWFSGVARPEVAGQYTQANVDYWDHSFRNRECTFALTYTVRSGGWDNLVQPGYVLGNWTNPNLVVIVAQPFTPNSLGGSANGAQANAINTGAYDGYWRQWGNSINAYVARGMPEPITEIGWEFNGSWFFHSAVNAASFVSAFQRVVTNIRATRPSALIAWTVNAGYSQNPPSHNAQDCWPGDSYVDFVGVDIYDHYPQAIGYSAVNTRENTVTGRAKYWEAFADAHSKQMVFPEWGVVNATNKQSVGGRDNPGYIEWMWDWFEHLESQGMMYGEAYFNDIGQTNVWSNLLPVHDNRNPNSRAKYLELWTP